MLGLRPSGLEFLTLCLESRVISFISPSSGDYPGPVLPIGAQRWPKISFMSFYFRTQLKSALCAVRVTPTPLVFLYCSLRQKTQLYVPATDAETGSTAAQDADGMLSRSDDAQILDAAVAWPSL